MSESDLSLLYPPIQPTTFDLRTGLQESVISAAASASGKSVLHLDPNPFYSSCFSLLSIADLTDFPTSHSTPYSDIQTSVRISWWVSLSLLGEIIQVLAPYNSSEGTGVDFVQVSKCTWGFCHLAAVKGCLYVRFKGCPHLHTSNCQKCRGNVVFWWSTLGITASEIQVAR